MRKRILVVEDDAALARIVRDNLLFEGFDVRCAAAAEDATSPSPAFAPDLVVLDAALAGGDVAGFAAVLRGGGHAPVIVLTTRTRRAPAIPPARYPLDAVSGGAVEFLAKPFDLDDLLDRVRALLALPALAP